MTILLSIVALLIVIFAALFVILEFSVIIISHYKGAPFVRSKKDRIRAMLELAQIKPGEKVVDLGSGDGIMVFESARLGAKATGIEVNPFLVWYSRFRTKQNHLAGKASFIRKNFRDVHLEEFDVIFLYLLPSTVESLKEKLAKELRPGTRVVSNAFPIVGWKPVAQKGQVFLYKI
jgi:2-polyprenyl-3-methyl-5-hydroxy-6-metoxy-1,4-benzoquinol methylase